MTRDEDIAAVFAEVKKNSYARLRSYGIGYALREELEAITSTVARATASRKTSACTL